MKAFDVAIIGSGPGGYVAAIRAGMLGLKTALIEKDPFLGGTCLHRGCIPTKALLHTAHLYDEMRHAGDQGLVVSGVKVDYPKVHKRKSDIVNKLAKGVAFLTKKRKVESFTGTGRLVDANTIAIAGQAGEEQIKADHIILATGSATAQLPHIKPDHKTILDSDSILTYESIPKSLAVIGAGAVGVEFASILNSFGSDVHIIEVLSHIVPIEDEEVSDALAAAFKQRGMQIHTSCKVTGVKATKTGATLQIEGADGNSELSVEKVLLSVGRRPVTEGLGLGAVGIEHDDKGYIAVNEFMQTNVPSVYAIGDIVRTPLLAHTASAEGILAVDHLAGKHARPLNYGHTPNCTYCTPEIASVGMTESAAKQAGYAVQVGKFPFAAIGKAMILGETDGFVKIVSDSKYDEVLGVHAIGPKATEFIAEACLGLTLETTVEEMAKTVHPHPTLSEAMMEAAHGVYGEAIHF